MKPEEMRDDIPMDVREALAEAMRYIAEMPCHTRETDWLEDRIESAIRPKPRTVHLPAAELPAPLEEVPEEGKVWPVSGWHGITWHKATHPDAAEAVELGLAFATREDAEAWLAHLQSWRNPRPGDDWTPHTPGDPMPCDGEAWVEVKLRSKETHSRAAASFYWQRVFLDSTSKADIIAWRYAREEQG